MTARQLVLSGGEVAHPPPAGRRSPLNATQVRILRVLRRDGVLRSVEAGVLVHQARGHCAFNTRPNDWPMKGTACCPYAANDGRAAMVRLMERGLVIRGDTQGTWIAKPPGTEQ